jgi:hypothetical protein
VSPFVWFLVVVFGIPLALSVLYAVIRILMFPIWLVLHGRQGNREPRSSSESQNWP